MSFLVAREDKKSKLFFATQYAHTHTHTYFLSHIFLFSFSHSYDIPPCRLSSKSSSSFAIALIALQPTAMTVKTLFHKEKPKSTKQLHDLLKKKSWLDNDYLLMLDWSVISWWIHWASKVWWLATSVCVCVGCIHGNKSLTSFFLYSGAFSKVYKAVDLEKDENVAVKVVRKYELKPQQVGSKQ